MCSFVVVSVVLLLIASAFQCLAVLSSSPAVVVAGRTFNVLSFGAAADGVTDDSQVSSEFGICMHDLCR
jgi:hypothetical protein